MSHRIIRTTRSWLEHSEDREELFIKQWCARWLRRYLGLVSTLEDQDLEMVCWCLGKRIEELVELLVAILEKIGDCEHSRDLLRAVNAPADLPTCMLESLNGQSRGTVSSFMQELDTRLSEAISMPLSGEPGPLECNLKRFAQTFELDRHETEFCLVLYLMQANQQVMDWMDGHLQLDRLTGRRKLGHILGMGIGQLNRMIHGKLTRWRILDESHGYLHLDDGFLPYLLDPTAEVTSDKLFRKALAPEVPLDFHFVPEKEVAHLKAILVQKRLSPTHVLLYGPPGTGKTSFVRALMAELNSEAYEVVKPTEDSDSARATRASIMGCLNLTNRGEGSVIMVDEADSLLNTENAWGLRGETHDKGWLNQLMDEPGVRMIWITNSIRGIEDSVIRRFAYSLHFRSFNRAQRARLWEQVLRRHRIKRLFSTADIKDLATKHKVSAGVMDLAVKKAAECYPKQRAAIHVGLNMALDANHTLISGGLRRVNKDRVEERYSLEGLNVDGDLEGMIQRAEVYNQWLRKEPEQVRMAMNLLFHGPPGTGKSELARHLAYRLDRELMVCRGSDILDPFVGMTERKLAQAFTRAEAEEAVLVIDEADSLLFSREQAVRSWEISQTNEFLTQMERFRGVMICTTNRLTGLDTASVRRFQEKVGFDHLSPEGNVIFFQRMLAPLAKGLLDAASEERLRGLANLTPGDFKVVQGRNLLRIDGNVHPPSMVDQLAREADIKRQQSNTKVLGF